MSHYVNSDDHKTMEEQTDEISNSGLLNPFMKQRVSVVSV